MKRTLDLMKFVGRRTAHSPALLVLSYRDDEVGPRDPLRPSSATATRR